MSELLDNNIQIFKKKNLSATVVSSLWFNNLLYSSDGSMFTFCFRRLAPNLNIFRYDKILIEKIDAPGRWNFYMYIYRVIQKVMYKMKSGIGDPILSREKWGT